MSGLKNKAVLMTRRLSWTGEPKASRDDKGRHSAWAWKTGIAVVIKAVDRQ